MAQAIGILGTQANVEAQFGTENVRSWSLPSGSQPATPTNQVTLQQAMNSADSYIIQRFFTAGNYSYPLAPNSYAQGIVTKWWSIICGYELYTARGLRDETTGNNLQRLYDQTIAEIQFYAAGSGANRLDAGYRWPVADAPTCY